MRFYLRSYTTLNDIILSVFVRLKKLEDPYYG